MRNKGVQQWSYKNHQTINKLITNKMKKTLFFLFIFISANAQNKRTINLEIAGTLFSKINTEINNISDITLTGNINNEDIIVLRNMVQNGSLEYVDMFDSYIHGEGDEDNVIPEEAFKNCTNLKSIIPVPAGRRCVERCLCRAIHARRGGAGLFRRGSDSIV